MSKKEIISGKSIVKPIAFAPSESPYVQWHFNQSTVGAKFSASADWVGKRCLYLGSEEFEKGKVVATIQAEGTKITTIWPEDKLTIV